MAIDPKKHEMPAQDPKVRAHNFEEVALGYSEETALAEASRCLNCKNRPCVAGCPVNVQIPEFIQKVKEGDFEAAYQIISETSSLPAVCGRVCPQETQCEEVCSLGIKFEPVGIGRLERFVADWHNENVKEAAKAPESNGHKVAIVGAGPAGLTCAGDLAKKGYKVTIYEALHTAGGVLVYGIPEFRLPKAIVAREVDGLKELGVEVVTNAVIGKTLTIDELFDDGFEAVFVGSGAGLPSFMNIPGESLIGVYSANEYLTRSNLMKAYKDDPDTPIMKGGRLQEQLSDSAQRRCTLFTEDPWRNSLHVLRKLSTQRRKESISVCSTILSRFSDITILMILGILRTVQSEPSAASRWSSESLTRAAEEDLFLLRAVSLNSR